MISGNGVKEDAREVYNFDSNQWVSGITGRATDRLKVNKYLAIVTSTGLGLSIAKLLTEKMGGTIGASCISGNLVITLWFRECV